MFALFDGITADEVWQKAASELLSGASATPTNGRGGPIREILHTALTIRDPLQRWVVSRSPSLNPAFALAEVVWILRGRNDSHLPVYFNPRLPSFQGDGPTFHGAYGYRLRSQYPIDQLDRAFRVLAADPSSRQVVLQYWDSSIDLPFADGRPRDRDIPCNVVSMPKVRGGALEWTQVMRSNDIMRGLPHNIVQFTSLQEVLAGWLGLRVGAYHHYSDSLHVYENDLFEYSCRPSTLYRSGDSLALDKKDSDQAFGDLEARIDRMTADDFSEPECLNIADWKGAPVAYANILRVLCSDTARRRSWHGVPEELMSKCTNQALSALWQNWFRRWSK